MLGKNQIVDKFSELADKNLALEKELKKLRKGIEAYYAKEISKLQVGDSLQLVGNERAITILKQERDSYTKALLEQFVSSEILQKTISHTEFLKFSTK